MTVSYHIFSSLTHEQQTRIALFYAHEVLPIWEQKYSEDLRPRKAVEAAWRWVLSPTEENEKAAYAATNAAHAAAYAAADAAWAAAHALSSQKFPDYQAGQLLSFRAITTSLQDSEPVCSIFLLQSVDDETCTLLDDSGKLCEVEKKILRVLRPV